MMLKNVCGGGGCASGNSIIGQEINLDVFNEKTDLLTEDFEIITRFEAIVDGWITIVTRKNESETSRAPVGQRYVTFSIF